MDRVIYTAMTGAKATMSRQDALANNLANVSTTGFRADMAAYRAVPIRGEGLPTRIHAVEATAGFDSTEGPLLQTGRNLDIAIRGQGWFAVQALDGKEAYTRAGSLEVGADGILKTQSGLPLLGAGGPISVPQDAVVQVGIDGTISAKVGDAPVAVVGRLKLINPKPGELKKFPDGLFRGPAGNPFPTDEAVTLVAGAIEGSNVNPVEAMVTMIAAARQFEMQMRMLQTAEGDEQRASKLLAPSS
jgi:flagellar basal-body rod protein FlgF